MILSRTICNVFNLTKFPHSPTFFHLIVWIKFHFFFFWMNCFFLATSKTLFVSVIFHSVTTFFFALVTIMMMMMIWFIAPTTFQSNRMQRYLLWERSKDAIGKFKSFAHATPFPFDETVVAAMDHAVDHFFLRLQREHRTCKQN